MLSVGCTLTKDKPVVKWQGTEGNDDNEVDILNQLALSQVRLKKPLALIVFILCNFSLTKFKKIFLPQVVKKYVGRSP